MGKQTPNSESKQKIKWGRNGFKQKKVFWRSQFSVNIGPQSINGGPWLVRGEREGEERKVTIVILFVCVFGVEFISGGLLRM